MKNYTLLLDESGDFKEGAKNTKPSIVAGWLLDGALPLETWARQFFSRVKASRPEYQGINIRKFHGMEVPSLRTAAFMTDLLCEVAGTGGRIVAFKNEKGRVIVNGDVTYLNVLADGIIALLRVLLKETEGDISLHVFYAQRTNVTKLERGNHQSPIDEEEYAERINERLELLIAKLPTTEQKRIGRRVTLGRAVATRNALLMLADAVCFALRGGKSLLDAEQKARIRDLPQFAFPVLEKETWETIQDCILQNHYAEAIFLWYGGYKKDLSRYQEEFHRQLVEHFSGTDSAEKEIDAAILSQYLQQLVQRGNYVLARQFIEAMESGFFPLMRENSISLNRLYFDLHFHNLTIATHEGRSKAESKEIEICRDGLRQLPSTYETLDYYLKYKLREIEHLKNSYDFRQAATGLERLVKILTSMMDLTRTIGELDGFSESMTSGTLGRVYGSLTTTRCFLGLAAPEEFAKARDDFEHSIQQFTNSVDLQRAYQNRAAVEYWSEQYTEAVSFLSLAFGGEKTDDVRKVLAAILQEVNLVTRKFGLMHFTSTMARAMLAKHPIGDTMMEAWQETIPDYQGSNVSYPVYLILWRLASCYALQDKEVVAKDYYDRAIKAAMSKKESFPSLATGLVMQLERIALLQERNTQEYIEQLKAGYEGFMASELPDAMRDWFAPWHEILEGVDDKTAAENKPEILRLAGRMPIL